MTARLTAPVQRVPGLLFVLALLAISLTPSPVVLGQGRCDRAYPTVCIPPPPPDLDCRDVPYRNFKVLPPDPHHFDRDRDGIGCET